MLGVALLWLGEAAQAQPHLEQSITLYEHERDQPLVLRTRFVHVKVQCLTHLAHTLWLLGYPDQARERVEEVLTLARGLSQPFSLSHALVHGTRIHQYRREIQGARELTEALIALAHEQGSRPDWMAAGTTYQGWLLAAQGKVGEGIMKMREGLDAEQARVHTVLRPYSFMLLAGAYGEVGQLEDGLNAVSEELNRANRTDNRLWDAELNRVKGELLLEADVSEAETCFQEAMNVSQQQGAKSLELRAVMSLSRLRQGQGKKEEARQMLAEIYGWFTEGFDTADLKEAKALLEELS